MKKELEKNKGDNKEEFAIGRVAPRAITEEMETSYLQYAMSVIISRALPDVRDGLKPVQRRILYSMWKTGLRSTAKFRKSANVVGDVMAKYHPHGNDAIYMTMVRMAQDFSMRYTLVEGQGNFGSMDGDNPAAFRYTEARLEKISDDMLFDIEKETVDWVDNYDGSRKEPSFLPTKLPQLLLNGALGIAVGMATNIPPHNLGELVDGIIAYIENNDITIEELLAFIKGPDFPTAGVIYNKKDILEAYSTGRGGIVTRAKADIVEKKAGQFQIIISEVTYQTNKAALIEKIANLVKTGKIDGIKDLRDESNKDGVRVVIELKKDAYPKKILNKLYKTTELQKTFHLNMLALVDDGEGLEPRLLNLKSILEYFVKHRQNVVTRRTEFELKVAKARAHILEGLKKALDHIDEIIKTIKKSPTKEEAHANLMKKFKLSDLQSAAILEMRLQTLAGLERKKIEDELKEKLALIDKLEGILGNPKKILNIIKKELGEVKDKYADERKTKVVAGKVDDFSTEDLVANEEAIISLTEDGYVKRQPPTTFKVQKRGGKGIIGGNIKEGDAVDKVLKVMAHDDLFFFTNTGKVFRLKAYEIPVSSRTSKGQAVVNFLQIDSTEKITSILAIAKDAEPKFIVMQTIRGKIKKTALTDFANVRRSGLIAIKLGGGDSLKWALTSSGDDDIMLVTKNGQSIRFREKQARPMGRAAAGVRALRLKGDDQVVSMSVINKEKEDPDLLVITENGFGKKTSLTKYKCQSRGGSGLKTVRVTAKTGKLISSHVVKKGSERDLIASSNKGQIIRTPIKKISRLNRDTQGVKIMTLRASEKVAATTVV